MRKLIYYLLFVIIISSIISISAYFTNTLDGKNGVLNDIEHRYVKDFEVVSTKKYNNKLYILYKAKNKYGYAIYNKKPFDRYTFFQSQPKFNSFYTYDNSTTCKKNKYILELSIFVINPENSIDYLTYNFNNKTEKVKINSKYFIYTKDKEYEKNFIRNISNLRFFDQDNNDITDILLENYSTKHY